MTEPRSPAPLTRRFGIERMKALALRILTEQSTPAKLGGAVALGLVVGTSPFYGFHLPICIALATLFGVNRAVTYLAANISIPPLLPFILFGSLQLGTLVREGHFLPVTLEAIEHLDPWRFAEAWLVGGFILGSSLGAVFGSVTYVAARIYRRRHPLPVDPIDTAIDDTVLRFAPQGRFVRGYVQGKLRRDPVYRQLAERRPHLGPLVDVGCGRGQGSVLLKLLQPELEVVASDWDGRKLERALQAASGLEHFSILEADLRTDAFPEAGTLLLVDVLHYNPLEVQDAILRRAAQALRPGGTLYVRDVDATRGVRARINIWQERLGTAIQFNRGQTLVFRSAKDIADVLTQAGLETGLVDSAEGLPLANVLIAARRPA